MTAIATTSTATSCASPGAKADAPPGFDFDGDDNVVDVYLGYLRKKVGKRRVENVRGVGFRVPS